MPIIEAEMTYMEHRAKTETAFFVGQWQLYYISDDFHFRSEVQMALRPKLITPQRRKYTFKRANCTITFFIVDSL